jgi:hypothetical protein
MYRCPLQTVAERGPSRLAPKLGLRTSEYVVDGQSRFKIRDSLQGGIIMTVPFVVLERAREVLAEPEDWLSCQNPSLGGITPAEACGTPAGIEQVLNLLKLIEFGTAA